MADYIYTMETRLTPEQLRGVSLVQDIARSHELNVYITGGAVRDLISGLPIRDLDFTIQGNPLKLQKQLEQAGTSVHSVEDDLKVLHVLLPGNVRAEIGMARAESYDKPGKPPVVTPATITEDLRRRDFTVNAMALSLNPGSRGLLLDPTNGVADIEAQLIRILHNYSFYEDPSRLIRATRYAARFHWPLEERTQARYDAAKENNYIEYVSRRAIGLEVEQLAYEDDPLNILRSLEKEGWLKVLHPHWSVAKSDTNGLTQLTKVRQQMNDLGYTPDAAAAVLYFLTRRLSEKEIADIRRMITRRDLIETWKRLEDDAKELTKRLSGKEAATPSRTWHLLSDTKPETILFTLITTKQQAAAQKINNFFGKWRQVREKLPLPEMAELYITPSLPEYEKIANEAFLLLLDGKLRSRTETLKFLKPYAPPPPPPPPAKRGRAAKAEAARLEAAKAEAAKAEAARLEAAKAEPAPAQKTPKRKGKSTPVPVVVAKVAAQAVEKTVAKAAKKQEAPAKPVAPTKVQKKAEPVKAAKKHAPAKPAKKAAPPAKAVKKAPAPVKAAVKKAPPKPPAKAAKAAKAGRKK
jgi:tRNA nucleotidyltransferase/poly(A) polymerase